MMISLVRNAGEWALVAAVALALLGSQLASAAGFDAPVSQYSHSEQTAIDLQYGHLFQTDTDNEGRMERDGLNLTINHRIALDENLDLTLQGGYQLTAYDFSGSGFSRGTGNFQWDDAHELRGVALFDWRLDERWSVIFIGALFTHAEGGANFSKGTTAGAGVGFDYQVNPDLKVGFLLGAMSAIEDSGTIFPIPRVDWRFAENWQWRVGVMSGFGGRGIGTELTFAASEDVDFTFGLMRQRKRFRLDHHTYLNPGPNRVNNGVGEESSVPAYIRMGFNPTSSLRFEALFGVAFGGELQVESRTGDRIENDQFDPAAMLGLNAVYKF